MYYVIALAPGAIVPVAFAVYMVVSRKTYNFAEPGVERMIWALVALCATWAALWGPSFSLHTAVNVIAYGAASGVLSVATLITAGRLYQNRIDRKKSG